MHKRILLTLDGSEISEQAIPRAVELVRCFDAKLFILRVITPLAKSFRVGMAPVSAVMSAEEQLMSLADKYLEQVIENLKKEGIDVQAASRLGIPYKEIINFASENRIDLIIMSTRGESGFTRWLLGSNTDHVIRGSTIPVYAVPAENTERDF